MSAKTKFVSTLLSSFFLASIADAQPTDGDITVASMEIPYAYTETGDGVYNTVLKKLTEGYKGEVNVSFMPSARFNRLMINREVDCDFIGTEKTDRWEKDGISADDLEFIGPIRELFVTVYVPAGGKVPKDIEELKTMRLASDVNLVRTIHRYGIKEAFALQSQVQMLNLLSIARIEALVGYDFDLDTLAPRLGVVDKIKKTDIRLDKLVDGIVCFKNEKTAPFRAHLRKRLKEVTENGWLDAEFEKFFARQGKQ